MADFKQKVQTLTPNRENKADPFRHLEQKGEKQKKIGGITKGEWESKENGKK